MKEQTKIRVGLDIGSYAVKMLVAQFADKPKLLGLASKKVSGFSREDVIDAVRTLASGLRLPAKDVVISVSGPSVTVRFISMPRMSDADLRSAIRFEAEKFISFNINDCILDFQVLKKDDSANKLNLLLVAAKKDYIRDKLTIATQAGLSVSVVDVDSFAMVNSLLKNPQGHGKENSLAVLNIGSSVTNLIIVEAGTVSFVRDVAMGGNDFSAAISKAMGIPIESAEDLKVSPKDKLAEMKIAVHSSVNALLDEVKLSFSYYENQSGKSVDAIYISGGSSVLAGLDEFIKDAFELDAQHWNPMGFLDTASSSVDAAETDKMKDHFAICSGLVLR